MNKINPAMSDITTESSPMPDSLQGGRPEGLQGKAKSRLSGLKAFICSILAAGSLAANPVPSSAMQGGAGTGLPIASYILKETGSSRVIMAKDIDHQVSPASLTKVLTSIMAIESGRLSDDVLITREATLVEPTKAGFRPGDKVKLRDLVKAAMVNSSNDAAFAIGIHLAGSPRAFASAMNARAKSLGMTHSRFTNPAGFDNGAYAGNRSTARDLMVLTEHAIRNPEFNAIARLDRADFTELTTGRRFSLKTHNKLLALYPYTVGIKTGFTNRAGKCLIARAVKNRKDLLMVMLDAEGDRWTAAADMFDSGFESGNRERLMPANPSDDEPAPVGSSASDLVLMERRKVFEELNRKVEARSSAAAVAKSDNASNREAERSRARRSGAVDERRPAVVASRPVAGKAGKSALQSKKQMRREKVVAMKAGRQTLRDAKVALKAKKHDLREKGVAMKSARKAGKDAKVALKSKKLENRGKAVALKSRKAERDVAKAALKSKKRSRQDARATAKGRPVASIGLDGMNGTVGGIS